MALHLERLGPRSGHLLSQPVLWPSGKLLLRAKVPEAKCPWHVPSSFVLSNKTSLFPILWNLQRPNSMWKPNWITLRTVLEKATVYSAEHPVRTAFRWTPVLEEDRSRGRTGEENKSANAFTAVPSHPSEDSIWLAISFITSPRCLNLSTEIEYLSEEKMKWITVFGFSHNWSSLWIQGIVFCLNRKWQNCGMLSWQTAGKRNEVMELWSAPHDSDHVMRKESMEMQQPSACWWYL